MTFYNDLKSDFTDSDKIYLNNASVSLTPKSAIDAMNDFLHNYNSIGPDSNKSVHLIEDIFISVRKTISKILNCQPDEIIFTQSTTDGINLVANGLDIDSNSNIIIRGGSHEHHANYYPWIRLNNRITIKNLSIDKNGFFNFDDLRELLNKETKLFVLSHALYNTGSILPVEKIRNLIDETPFFIDSAQTVGCLDTVDLEKIKCNFMAFNGSKWLCGPMGIGIFFCRRDSSNLLAPTEIGGESALIYDSEKIAFKNIPEKFQTGFRNYLGLVGLDASLKYLLHFGISNIRKKNMQLSNILREELRKINGITIYGPEDEDLRTSIVSFNLEKKDPHTAVDELEKLGFILAVREIGKTKIVRASPHFLNSEEEIYQLIEEIKKL